MIQVARGRLSKQIAGDIGIAEATVKVHRSRADAKDEGPFASRARPNGGQAQTGTRGAATLLNRRISFSYVSHDETARCAVLMVRRLGYNVLHPLDPPLVLEAAQDAKGVFAAACKPTFSAAKQ